MRSPHRLDNRATEADISQLSQSRIDQLSPPFKMFSIVEDFVERRQQLSNSANPQACGFTRHTRPIAVPTAPDRDRFLGDCSKSLRESYRSALDEVCVDSTFVRLLRKSLRCRTFQLSRLGDAQRSIGVIRLLNRSTPVSAYISATRRTASHEMSPSWFGSSSMSQEF